MQGDILPCKSLTVSSLSGSLKVVLMYLAEQNGPNIEDNEDNEQIIKIGSKWKHHELHSEKKDGLCWLIIRRF
jgi:hypothetical protein